MTNKYFEDRSDLQDIYVSRDIADMFLSPENNNIRGGFLLGNDADQIKKVAAEVDKKKAREDAEKESKKKVTGAPANAKDAKDAEDAEDAETESGEETDEEDTDAESQGKEILAVNEEDNGEDVSEDDSDAEDEESEDEEKTTGSGFDDLWEDGDE